METDIYIEEKPTGEISAGAGFGTAGGSIGGSVKENNFLGTGVALNTSISLTEETIRGMFSVNNPNFRYSGNSLNASVQSMKISKLEDYGYESTKTGFSLGTAFEQYKDITVTGNISSFFETLDTNTNASANLKKQQGSYFDTVFGYGIINDKRNQKFQTSQGYVFSFNQSLPVYAEQPYISDGVKFSGYYSPTENIIGNLKFSGRHINGLNDKDVKISNRLSVPYRSLRGFQIGKIGPVDSGDFIGGNYLTTLGASTSFPNLLPGSTNVDISLFIDSANLWGVDYSDTIDDSNKIRSSIGTAANWYTPIGPLSFSLAQNISKASTDKTERFRFQIGTSF